MTPEQEGLADAAHGKYEKALPLFDKAVLIVQDPVKVLSPPHQLYLSRAQCLLNLARPTLALSDSNKALKVRIWGYNCKPFLTIYTIQLEPDNLLGQIIKAESLYSLLMFEKALVMFTRLNREKPDNKKVKMGIIKCSQAIENSIAQDCFEA